jgi:hypothetical protein
VYKDLERGFASLTKGLLGKYEGASGCGVVSWDFGQESDTRRPDFEDCEKKIFGPSWWRSLGAGATAKIVDIVRRPRLQFTELRFSLISCCWSSRLLAAYARH